MRKYPLVNNETYHIFTKSIANFNIFNDDAEYHRMIQLIAYYKFKNKMKFSDFLELKSVEQLDYYNALKEITKENIELVKIIAYCLMPTHLHLILKQNIDRGITNYMSNILNSYTRYFNTKHKRKGPLWESEFKNVLVMEDEQLLHLTRYLHLNPVTAHIVEKPENWNFSSYSEFISQSPENSSICDFKEILDINPAIYRKFVSNQISYQRELAVIKQLLLDE